MGINDVERLKGRGGRVEGRKMEQRERKRKRERERRGSW
jgi:hypothetical protein